MAKTINLDNQRSSDYLRGAGYSPLVSVVVTTKNEEKNIARCLLSIRNQTYRNIEVIVVDNFSDDRTVEIARKFLATVCFKGNERSAQRNYGVNSANGEYVLYLDADMLLDSVVIEECIKKVEHCAVRALYIPERIVGQGFWIKVRDFERSFYTGTIIDAVRFVQRNLFLEVGGFDETLVGPEDWDFDRKIRQTEKPACANASIYHNEGNFNIKRYLKKKRYYVDGLENYVGKWGANDVETAKQVGTGYRLIGVFIENGKWKKLIRHPLLSLAMYTLRLAVAVAYLEQRK